MGQVKEEWLEEEQHTHEEYSWNKGRIIKPEDLWKSCPCYYCRARRKENRT